MTESQRHGGGATIFDQAGRFLSKTMDYALGIALALMVILVFANVIARYGFNSGITISEEVSRLLLVWVVFLGAIVAMREHAHLGVNSLVVRLPIAGQKICFALVNVLILVCCVILAIGSWHHMLLGHSNVSPVTGIPQSFLFLPGLLAAIGIGLLVVGQIWRLITGSLTKSELVQVRGEEDAP